ncbi:uncharacterized protein [Dendrobates tinctorius]|uniref:uncharacterized protein n=1 Tax=Dendrobates tinctorius TaxID=92724 RepID=UPI003CCA45BC
MTVGPSATPNMPPKTGTRRRRRQETTAAAPSAPPPPQMEHHAEQQEGSPAADERCRPRDAAAAATVAALAAAVTPPTGMECGHQEDSTSSSGSPPSHRQRLTESQDEEELPEEEGRGGQIPGVGSQLSSQSGARSRGPRSASQGRRRQQRGGHQRVSINIFALFFCTFYFISFVEANYVIFVFFFNSLHSVLPTLTVRMEESMWTTSSISSEKGSRSGIWLTAATLT